MTVNPYDIESLGPVVIEKHKDCKEDADKPCGWTVQFAWFTIGCEFPSAHEVECADKNDPEHSEYCLGTANLCCYHNEIHAMMNAKVN